MSYADWLPMFFFLNGSSVNCLLGKISIFLCNSWAEARDRSKPIRAVCLVHTVGGLKVLFGVLSRRRKRLQVASSLFSRSHRGNQGGRRIGRSFTHSPRDGVNRSFEGMGCYRLEFGGIFLVLRSSNYEVNKKPCARPPPASNTSTIFHRTTFFPSIFFDCEDLATPK